MNINQQVQLALQSWLQSQAIGDIADEQVYCGIENTAALTDEATETVRVIPCVICRCENSRIENYGTGNWTASARVEVHVSADDYTDAQNQTFANTVWDVLITDSIAADLTSALADFTAFVVRIESHGYSIEERTWVNYLEMEIDCCASDIS